MFLCVTDFARSTAGPKAVEARVALLDGLAMAVRLRHEGCGAGKSTDNGDADHSCGAATAVGGEAHKDDDFSARKAIEMAEQTADEILADHSKGGSLSMGPSQVLVLGVFRLLRH